MLSLDFFINSFFLQIHASEKIVVPMVYVEIFEVVEYVNVAMDFILIIHLAKVNIRFNF